MLAKQWSSAYQGVTVPVPPSQAVTSAAVPSGGLVGKKYCDQESSDVHVFES